MKDQWIPISFFFKNFLFILFIYFWPSWVFAAWAFLQLQWAGAPLAVIRRLLTVVASSASEHGLPDTHTSVTAASELSSYRSPALEHRLNSCGAWA